MIDDVVASIVVLPNKITVPLTNIDPYELKYPLPDVSKAWPHPGQSFPLSLCGPIQLVGLKLTWSILVEKLALHITIYG